MNPSKALITSSRLSMACGFSILAITGSSTPSSCMTLRTSSTSRAERTKDSAMKSTVRCSPQRRSSMSFSDMAGTLTATPGRLMPLLSLIRPPVTTCGVHLGVVDLGHPQADLAVVDQDLVAVADVAGQPGVRRGGDLVVAVDLARGDRERLPGLDPGRALLEAAQPDLGALQVDEDAHAVAGLVGSLAHPAVDLLVLGVAAVAEVEPGDVHPGVHQLSDPLG